MSEKIYKGYFASYPIRYSFLCDSTHLYFENYLNCCHENSFEIRMTQREFNHRRQMNPDFTDGYIEYKGLIFLTAQYLLKYHCCIFHSVSFVYKGYAWLLCAPSGTGKTTQYRNWIKIYPGEIQMISGDMPILELKNNHIYVHPSPWNGKERIHNNISAPLGGLIYLKQGSFNFFEEFSTEKGIISVFNQFKTVLETEEEIQNLAQITDCVFRNYPVKLYINSGNDESTKLLKKKLDEVINKWD